MTKIPAEMMRKFVKSQNFTSTEDIMAAMKDMFKDLISAKLSNTGTPHCCNNFDDCCPPENST